MPRQQGTEVENTFSKGLITEATALSFPKDAATDANNVVFDLTGTISKRVGLDFETNYRMITTDIIAEEAISEYVWHSVAGDGTRAFFVLQKGKYLYFYDVSNSSDISPGALPTLKIILSSYLPASTSLNPAVYACQYCSGNGDLVVVNRAMNPIYIYYTPSTGTLTVTAMTLSIRDFRGLNDGLAIDERPTSSASGLMSTNPAHYYNILNQGWVVGNALTQWDTDLTSLPSNCDYPSLFRSSETDAFDATEVTAKTGYNTPAPKGHYILNAFSPDRTLGGDLTFSGIVTFPAYISPTGLTSIGNVTSAFLYDGIKASSSSSGAIDIETSQATIFWMGKSFASSKTISKAILYGSNNVGYAFARQNSTLDIDEPGVTSPPKVASFTVKLYAKSGGAPSNATDGTLLGTISFSDTPDESGGREIFSNDNATSFDHMWVTVVWNSAPVDFTALGITWDYRVAFAELELYEFVSTTVASADDIVTFQRPTTVEFYQGRVFYSGVVETNLGSNVYFSQIAEKREQMPYCYQKNDPTSEYLSDLLADDGGLIKIPDAGTIVRIKEFQGALLVLATNGVWIIQGSAGAPFLATAYEVRKISASGTNSPLSVASFRGQPIWWGSEGIMTISYDPAYGSFSVTNLSNTTIQSMIDDVNINNRRFVKGTCDTENSIIYWLYNDNENLPSTDYYKYNRILLLNMITNAFYPYEVTGDVSLRGVTWVQNNATANSDSSIKLTTSYASNSLDFITFSSFMDGLFTDWNTYSDGVETIVDTSALTKINDATSNATKGNDGTTTQTSSNCVIKTTATSMYYGFTLGTAKKVSRVHYWGSSNAGFVNSANPSITTILYGKNGTAPSSGTDGTLLATRTFTDSANESTRRELVSNDTNSTWDHVWLYVVQDGSSATMYIAETQFYTLVADATKEVAYDATVTTGYMLDGQSNKFFQPNYVMVFLNTVEDSSCFMQGVFDFTNSDASGKWSNTQQLYNSALTFRDINYRRLKIRGKGRALQLKFDGEAGKPFEIIGWSIWKTSNAAL